MATVKQIVARAGFNSMREFHLLTETRDKSTPAKEAAFREWQTSDGTKEGLLALPQMPGLRFTCPDCGRTSHNPNDALYHYCGACHEFKPTEGETQ